MGDVARVTIRYIGTPERYDVEQDRYWSRGTESALWLTFPHHWLPMTLEPGWSWQDEWYWQQAGYHLTLSVPSGWSVIVPGYPVARDRIEVTARSPDPPPIRAVAGPYSPAGSGSVGEWAYEVWGLPPWPAEAALLAAEAGPIIEYVSGLVNGPSPRGDFILAQVPVEMGDGVAYPSAGVTLMAPYREKGTRGSAGDGLSLWVHELTHLVAPELDDGLADFVALLYLRERDPAGYEATLAAQREFFVAAVKRHGDRSIARATANRLAGRPLPELHAYCYTKPALVWNMFLNRFGEEATVEAVRRLARPAPEAVEAARASAELNPGLGLAGVWLTLIEQTMTDVIGEPGPASTSSGSRGTPVLTSAWPRLTPMSWRAATGPSPSRSTITAPMEGPLPGRPCPGLRLPSPVRRGVSRTRTCWSTGLNSVTTGPP